jgi:hypothetical protein
LESSTVARSGAAEAIILVKAAPVIGIKHGETVCCAGVDLQGNWLRMYPVSFRVLEDSKRFKRWDRVRFTWRKPTDDARIESRHVDSQSLEITGSMPPAERQRFLDRQFVSSLSAQREKGLSFALLKPVIKGFRVVRKAPDQVAEQQAKIDRFHSQTDLFIPRPAVPVEACPFEFKYHYRTDDGDREGTCQDWETEATFFHWRQKYGEERALREMQGQFGEVLPQRGLCFAMGTHSLYPDVWLINGLIQIRQPDQASLF